MPWPFKIRIQPAWLQVQSILGEGGALTPDRAAGLESLREKMGLPKEAADKIIRGFTNQKLIQNMQVGRQGPELGGFPHSRGVVGRRGLSPRVARVLPALAQHRAPAPSISSPVH